MSTIITLTMPRGPAGRHEIDLDTLTPMARATAEAIAHSGIRRIAIVSRRPMRDMYRPGEAEFVAGRDSPKLDEPMRQFFDQWMANTGQFSIHQALEWEARKFPGWYPVADDWSDLPSTPAAREDDGIDVDEVMRLLRYLCPKQHIDLDRWMRFATKGLHGLPAPSLHNGYRSMWSEAAVRELAADPERLEQAQAAA